MNREKLVNMLDLIYCITNTGDLISNEITNHHIKVAYMAYRIGEKIGFTKEQQQEIFIAGLLHDIGAFSTKERLELIHDESPNMHRHSYIGASILEKFRPLANVANIIRYHHVPWNYGKGNEYKGKLVPLSSHVLHLADRIVVQVKDSSNIMNQVNNISSNINKLRGKLFIPELVDAFLEISKYEYIWLDTVYKPLMTIIPSMINFNTIELSLDEVIDLSEVFAYIIDFRSPFTANHSFGVAQVAKKLAELAGFSENECKMMLIAGYLHDLGKLAISNEILEKPDILETEEFNIIKSHVFYTYRTLQSIKEFETINIWASLHHERLNGTGYPFRLTADEIPLGSRIMAVADIFTAISEDRPYRKGMKKDEAIKVLKKSVDNEYICPYICKILEENYDEINLIRKKAQEKSNIVYNKVNTIRSCS